MNVDALIDEICSRVQAKIEACGDGCSSGCAADSSKPRLLILTRDHGTICHDALECPVLGEYYQTECALLKEYQCDIMNYEAVIAYNLDNEALGKIAGGIFDSGYTRLFGQAILAGRKVFVPEEEVELFKYADTAPAAYYRQLEQNVNLLKNSGVTILPKDKLQDAILHGAPSVQCSAAPAAAAAVRPAGGEKELVKRVITEKDIYAATTEGISVLVIGEKAILTDLARESVSKNGIQIVRK